MENFKETTINDNFLSTATEYATDNHIRIETCDDTLGNVMRWMAAFDEDEYKNHITKDNYRILHADSNMDMTNRYKHSVINGSGILTYFVSKNGKEACKEGYDENGNVKEYPLNTHFIDIVCDYAENHWDDKVHIISYYSGCQGLLAITVYDEVKKNALFSFDSLEMYGQYRAQ